ncbi:MAG TPA: aldehyde ferredoxin oxidoreductase family protein [Methanolinea sp.]|nr:aldehyde ferredoxin oxidoreductase family protein [Methanolinea sp.]HQE86518.1 aldehyde ferredoxin oxidoreductase family protein [Methanolinea sp.]HQI14202.1 aldehyde ferredoxin oxidoreductase family protein [Methanolinea sp.]HQJ18357.1 aldehyde ferredoxin oxidoreductase family protein [Methanolinea sp.]
MDAYAGKIADIDLTRKKVTITATPSDWKKRYLGGRGFGARVVTDRVNPRDDPLGEKNVFVLASGPTTGTGIPLGSRYEISAKSPLNGTLMSSNSGGVFGWKLKRAGFDAVILNGKAEKPSYIYLNEGKAEIRDASPYWGKTTHEATEMILSDLGDTKAKVACIGPAGERKSLLACVINDMDRAAGRSGGGAVMGSKNVKAIVAAGDLSIGIADEERLNTVKERVREKLEKNGICQALTKYGTAVLVNIINEAGILPTRNFQSAHFADAEKVSGEALAEKYLKKNKGCYACIVRCSRVTEVDGEIHEGPEYEPLWAFTADLGINDLAFATKATWLCNKLGLDAIGTPTAIACAMEMKEKGYIRDGPQFGSAEGILDLIRQMAYREGFGAELSDGSYRFAEKHGHPELSMSVKKQDIPAYDPRGLQGHGLEYATSVRGADHVYGYMVSPEVLGAPVKLDPYTSEGKAQWTKTFQDLTAAIDASGMCLFSSFALDADDYADLISAATGMSLTGKGLLHIGERIWNLQRLYNLKAGYTKDDDTLPPRLLNEPLREGAPKGRVWQRQPLLDEYYELRGWDKNGVPTRQKLEELGLA